jgi:hypothetical protein
MIRTLCALVLVAGVVFLPAADKKPVILLNTLSESAEEGTLWDDGSELFAAALKADGFDLRQQAITSYTDEILADVDVLALFGPMPLLDADKEVLNRFIQRGGGIVFGLYPGYGDATNINSLTSNYGITITGLRNRQTTATVVSGSTLSKPYPSAVIGSDEGRHFTLTIGAGTAAADALDQDGLIFVAHSTHANLKSGRLVVICYDIMFTDNRLGDREGNLNFGRNLMKYLAGTGVDLAATGVKAKGKSIFAGDAVTVIIKGRNLSGSASSATDINIILAEVDPMSGGPGKAVKVLGKSALAPVNANAKFKINKAVKIPGTLNPGEYFLIVTIDPNEKTNDPQRSNNSKTSKRIVIQ